jgi:hypothetical protein
MGTISKYWRLVRIDSFGHCQIEDMEDAKAFLHQQFSGLAEQEDIPDKEIQCQLLRGFRSNASILPGEDTQRMMAELCLRCFISNEMKNICLELADKFGKNHDFDSDDLLPLVLDTTAPTLAKATPGIEITSGEHDSFVDKVKSSVGFRSSTKPTQITTKSNPGIETTYRSLTTRILQSFDPNKSNLSVWTTRMVKSDKEVQRFLLAHGIEQVTDWLILNQRTPGGLQRILSEFYRRTATETQQAVQLLESYHQVYRVQLLEQRQQQGKTKVKSKYPPPTEQQLRQIAELLSATRKLSPEAVLTELQDLAKLIRGYRIYARGGPAPRVYLDNCDGIGNSSNAIGDSHPADNQDELTELLKPYRDACLKQAVEQVIQHRLSYLQRKKGQKHQIFLKALHLFHCQGIPMGEIAAHFGWQAQYQVSRLLKLKDFRADVARRMLVYFRDSLKNRFAAHISKLTQDYNDPDSLHEVESKMQEFLKPQIDQLIQAAEKEANNSKCRVMSSQFSQTICHYLDIKGS